MINFTKITILLLLFNLIISCTIYKTVTAFSYSEPITPNWYQYLTPQSKGIAMFPFEGFSIEEKSIAKRIESGIRSNLIKLGQITIVEREHLEKIIDEQKFTLFGLTENQAAKVGEMLGVSVILIGGVTNYFKEEVYSDYVEGGQYAGDKYTRVVNFVVNVRVISVQTGEILWEEEKLFNESTAGYKNIRRIKKENTESGSKFLDVLNTVVNTLADLDLSIKAGIKPFSTLSEKCVTDAINYFYWKLIAYKMRYQDTYRIDKDGKKERISHKYISSVPVDNIFETSSSRFTQVDKVIDQTQKTKLPYLRLVLPAANKYSDEEILNMYRKKYPVLKEKTDELLIQLIEKRYKKAYLQKSE